MIDDGTRSIEIFHDLEGTPEEVWDILTTAEGLKNWFPLDARVEAGGDGSVWLSWGPGCEGEAPIHVWDRPHRFGWTESYGDDPEGRPIKVAVDFFLEGKEGGTVLRFVQSGFSADEQWDDLYDALTDGWTYFLFNLAFFLQKHRGKSRKLVWKRVATELARDVVWERLLGGALVALNGAPAEVGTAFRLQLDEPVPGVVVSARPGHHFTGTVPGLDDSLLFIEIEGSHVGIWLSTYGMEEDRTAALQASLERGLDGLL
jgi:uncharacterized protein YndB with AHSA1/START domain